MIKIKLYRVIIGVFVAVIAVLAIMFGGVCYMNDNDNRVLRFGLGTDGWGPLYPAQQSSLYAAIIISHVFDSLVGVDKTGGFTPNLAKAWDINEECTKYVFVIDTSRSFSDGTPLTASLYKRSLLDSLRKEAAAKNKSALDVLYALEGYSDFDTTDDISGLEVIGDDRLIMHFEHPYRRAIDQLSGTRYGAYIIRNGEYLGTGPYKYLKVSDGDIELSINPFYPDDIPIKHVKITSAGQRELNTNAIDVALGVRKLEKPATDANIETKSLSTLLAAHWAVIVNGMKGHIFHDKSLRQAAQYLIYHHFINEVAPKMTVPYFEQSPQFYPPLYQGHIDVDEEERLILEGSKYVNILRERSKTNPIRCVDNVDRPFKYCEALEQADINVVSEYHEFASMKNILFKSHDADLLSGTLSFASADPDGIYHFLGLNGAIWSPMSSRPAVENMLETGRQITDVNAIHEYYQSISRKIIEEVPVIHLGSQSLFLAYNADRLIPADEIAGRRKALNVTLLQWR